MSPNSTSSQQFFRLVLSLICLFTLIHKSWHFRFTMIFCYSFPHHYTSLSFEVLLILPFLHPLAWMPHVSSHWHNASTLVHYLFSDPDQPNMYFQLIERYYIWYCNTTSFLASIISIFSLYLCIFISPSFNCLEFTRGQNYDILGTKNSVSQVIHETYLLSK